MGDEGDIWNEHKEYKRQEKEQYEKSISSMLDFIIKHRQCAKVGDHWRFQGVWDFWHTGTVFNIRTKERIWIEDLHDMAKKSI